MLDKRFYCVLMAGGSGDKLWPWSRENKPKQFASIGPGRITMLKRAYDRCLRLVPQENILVATLEKYKPLVQEILPDLKEENMLLEPIGRQTAPCTVYSAYTVFKRDPDAVITMVPADSIIENNDQTCATMKEAMVYAAEHDVLLTMGVIPTRPETQYGYIQVAGGKEARDAGKPAPVKTFTEKPDESIATAFCKSGEFFWNSGIYIWKAALIKEECESLMPSITELFAGWEKALGGPEEKAFLNKVYDDCPKISIDYGLMEKTERAWIFPINFRWTDLDNWDELYEDAPKADDAGNICNTGAYIIKDSKSNVILSENRQKLVAVRGLEDYIVVDTDDVLLICPRNREAYNDLASATGFPDFEKFR
ncbi:MAG: sugar phosphate nucleotidyltransferase [Bacteroidales bacterium]|nr:sugar phosphate nucleotidyltransferase [Bacteroidales bacterium]